MKLHNWYRFEYDGDTYIGQYMGREQNFECMVCGKGNNAYCFNIWHSDKDYDYETFSFGKEHLPKLEDLGKSDKVLF